MKNTLFCLCICLFIISCDEHFNTNELYGTYASVNYKNTYDTIKLKRNSLYHRNVRDKNNKLVLEMDGKWEIEKDGIIRFHSFFFNLDKDIIKFPQLLSDTLNDGGGWIETKSGNIQFCVGYQIGENCYRKIK